VVKIAMEARYKDALRSAYKLKLTKTPSREYRDHLFSVGWCYRAISKGVIPASTATSKASEEVAVTSEKEKVIESLKDFSQDLLEKNETDALQLDKIEISLKDSEFQLDKPESFTPDYAVSLSSANSFDARYKFDGHNKFELTKLKIIFVADTLRDVEFENTDDLTEFEALFDQATAQLFSKMVKAMKLKREDYLLTAISFGELDKKDSKNMVLSEIHHFQPELVISLGVSDSHALIDTKQRLKDLHGNFYPIHIDTYSGEIMPLFSPSLLNSAPHMKNITWVDMQKAMEKLSI
jgi:uracil-DNA glycosylase family 4